MMKTYFQDTVNAFNIQNTYNTNTDDNTTESAKAL